ncbi:murein hydrolase activator EnvC family protein [Flavisolibacter ginsenosidimutans]|uniref:Peptidoglycan DD-metalloendopeptidase family protein n=1 Tax=Flavisolibacter ginsenosidimutans TaxID=661481 RepID=A0A5B8UHQ1_9BACT|nr:peptidoglycan DD-metalloendopeptidase family protein [Flavisolibacter ginsenosidimutans]QEC55866.1 peptidoglycan DD-metalloendopeptidase family protein [Flavisolibacter ginsenosidimutans]
MKKLLILFVGLFALHAAFAQSAEKERMQRERQQLQAELKEIQANYNKVKGQQKATIGQLTILQNKMQVQNRYISNINSEIKLLNDDIYVSNQEITRLQRQLDTLKAEYARSVVYSYKNNNSYDYINFIFSASNFNDAVRRVSYLKSYRAYNEKKVQTIKETKALIEQRKGQLQGKTKQKASALENQKDQLNELEDQKKEKDRVASKLKSQANDLSKQMAVKKKRDAQLRNQIAAIIRRDMERAREEERKRLAAAKAAEANRPKNNAESNTGSVTTTPKVRARTEAIPMTEGETKLAASFVSNRGHLPWPVDGGFVSIPYGPYEIGGLKMVNDCITISTPSAGVSVKAVFDGTVTAVSNVGEGMFVMIKHGNYYSGYTLSSASVSRGETVRTGQVIGRAATADDGSGGQVDFYLMQGEKHVNPRPWLR